MNGSLYEELLTAADFDLVCREIYDYCGINITAKKKQMIEGRLRSRIRILGLRMFSEYCNFVFREGGYPDEFIHLIDSITTNKTEFFRERDHFSYLRSHALPNLLHGSNTPLNRPLSIWSAACSTGQEPYTLAIELAEFKRLHGHFDFQIFATDICTQVLETGKRAVYSVDVAEDIPPDLQKRYLLKSKDASRKLVRIAPEIRRLVRFNRLNLKDEDYGVRVKMDIIFCRNVIIYFDAATKEAILRRLALCLRKGGLLFLGHSESLHRMDIPVRPVASTIYARV